MNRRNSHQFASWLALLLISSILITSATVRADVITGTRGTDVLHGTPRNDVIYGLEGSHHFHGGAATTS